MKPQYEHVVQVIERQVALWQGRLGLAHWTINNNYSESRDTESQFTTADTDALWQYLDAHITWYLPEVAAHDDNYIDKTVVHELVHVLLAPLEDATKQGPDKDKQSELAATMVENAIWRAYL